MKVEIVNGPLDIGKPSKPRYRMRRENGEWVRVRVVDADSPTFAADFLAAFRANVRRVRRERRVAEAEQMASSSRDS
ncbi:hypothetical protein [Flavisphingomonas formosensis]|uniref:hypothetical protein n=1 Tax=Flavisphingomonas formosensis TaxID=861534 RepID=UPI0012F9461F|nr:hypothetical protein [Sphingomonas formosensis]